MKFGKLLAVVAVILMGSVFMLGQDQPNVMNGIPPQGSYDSSNVDTVNLVNGNLTLHIPLPFDYPQRGKLGIKYYLVLNSKTWQAQGDPNTMTGQWWPTSACGTGNSGPCGQDSLFVSTASFAMTRIWEKVWPDGQFPSYSATVPDTLTTWDGANHPIGGDTSGYTIQVSGDDGNGVYTTATIIDRNGVQYSGGFGPGNCTIDPGNGLPGSTQTTTCYQQWSLSSVTDANGNVLSPPVAIPGIGAGSGFGGAHAAVGSESVGCTSVAGPIWVSYLNYPAPNGQTNQIKLCFATYPQLATAFSQAGVHQFQDVYSGHPFPGTWRQPVYLSNVIFPDSTQWAISYDSYGEVTSVATPTGATIQYNWGEGSFPRCNIAGNDITKVSRAVQSRTMTDVNGHIFARNYLWTPQASDGTLSHTMTDPSGNDTVHTFVDLTAAWITPSCDFRETRTVSYQGSGASRTALKQVDTTWLNSRTGGAYGVPSDVKTTLFPSNKVTLVHKDYAPGLPFLDLVTSQKTYDWGQGAPGAMLREEDTVYQWQKDSRYLAANLIDLPASSVIISPVAASNIKSSCPVDGVGTTKACMAEIDYTYDETAHLTNYESTVGALPAGSHVAAPNPVRGNPTTESTWLSTGGSVVSHTNWYDTGEVYQAIDPLGHTTTHSYDLAYNGALSTKTCNAKSQCVSATYDVNTGLLTSFTDANGSYAASGTTQGDPAHTTTYSYDFMRRITSSMSPADSNGNHPQVSLSYPSPTIVQQLKAITTSVNNSVTTHSDGLEHIVRAEHNMPVGTVIVDTAFDGLGHTVSTTNPYLTTADATYGIVQTVYDGVGRATNVTEQDGSVKTVDYSGGNCIVTADEAGKQRKSCKDGLSRLIEVDEPQIGSAGTPASGGVNVSGSLRSLSGATATPGTGSVTLSGTEQSKPSTPAKSASGSVTITGSDRSVTVGGGSYCAMWNNDGDCVDWEFSPPTTTYDWGTVSITVNGFKKSVPYDQSSTPSSIAAALASAFNGDTTSPVTASAAASVVTLTAKAAGTGGNSYALSITSATSDPSDFIGASFGGSTSGSTLAGGANVGPTIYDSGTCSITVAGTAYSTSFGQGDTISTIAARLAGVVNGGSLVTDTASGATESLTAKVAGTASNYTLGATCSHDSVNFSSGSFAASASGSTLAGGTNAGAPTVDSGTVTLSIGSATSVTACYGPSGSCAPVNGCATGDSTSAQVACALGKGLSASGSPVMPTVSGSSISMVFKTPGLAGNVVVSVVSTPAQPTVFPGGSFTGSATLSGGVDPVPASLQNPYVTLYSYDALGNLLRVDQKGTAPNDSTQWRTRLFTYDSLSRLLTAYNPESGTASYSYDADGNLLQKTSPQANQTGTATATISYCYDELHRPTKRDYAVHTYAPPACPITASVVSYVYDAGTNGKGYLTSLTDQAGSATYNYDALGRLSSEQRTIAGVSKSLSYTYNLDNSIATVTYPSGAVVTYTPDSAGRMLSAADIANGINYVTGATYGPDSALTGFVNGNTITNSFSYNKRLQPVFMSASAPSQTVFSIGYDFHLGAGDNGNVFSITNNRDSTRNQTFTYDALNRLASAQNSGTDCSVAVLAGKTKFWGNSYGYDAWGNLLQKTITKCSAENLSLTAGNDNRLQGGYTYDAAGNMTHDATSGLNYNFDTENRITGAGGYTYTYDADGNRVEKSNGTTGTLYWYMAPGIVGESALNGTLTAEYVFFDGRRVARKDFPGNAVSYYFSDHLKAASVITDAAGNIKSESDFYPWGGELQFTNNDSNRYRFAGKENDGETGLYYFGARYYSTGLGRFITPDWAAKATTVPYADFGNPQSLNLYSYVLNNPLTLVDEDGHEAKCEGNTCTEYVGVYKENKSEDNAAGGKTINYTLTIDKVTTVTNEDGSKTTTTKTIFEKSDTFSTDSKDRVISGVTPGDQLKQLGLSVAAAKDPSGTAVHLVTDHLGDKLNEKGVTFQSLEKAVDKAIANKLNQATRGVFRARDRTLNGTDQAADRLHQAIDSAKDWIHRILGDPKAN